MDAERAGIANALGRTLAEAVVAASDVPAYSTATREGYAARAADTSGATQKSPRLLSVLADRPSQRMQIVQGTVVPVRAGDALPPGADTVIDSAHTFRPTNDPQVSILDECKLGENMRPAGSVIARGETLVPEGELITCLQLGLMSAAGGQGVLVRRKPSALILTTGAHVVDTVNPIEPGEERNTARYYLMGAVMEAGGEIQGLVHVREGRTGLEKALAGLGRSDLVLVALGPGERHDAAVLALRNTGDVLVERLDAHPCTASAFALVNGKPVFLFSSESALEAFEAMVRPALLAMLGQREIDRPKVRARLDGVLRLNPGYQHFVRAMTVAQESGYTARPLTAAAPGTRPWALPNSLLIVPQNTESLRRGDMVEAILLHLSTTSQRSQPTIS